MEIKKYTKIYLSLVKRNVMTTLSYSPFSVFLELFVELGYQISFIVLIDILYGRVVSIGGWNRHEMMFFVGLNMFMSQMLLSFVFIGSLFKLPELIRTGGLDTILTKPVNAMFMLSLGNPYVSGIISGFPGIYLMFSSAHQGNLNISFYSFISSILLLVLGSLLIHSVSMIFSSLAFKFPDSRRIVRLTSDAILNFSSYPLGVYQKPVERFLMYIFPIIFFVAVPAQVMLRGIDYKLISLSVLITGILFYVAKFVWKKALLNYSSVSS